MPGAAAPTTPCRAGPAAPGRSPGAADEQVDTPLTDHREFVDHLAVEQLAGRLDAVGSPARARSSASWYSLRTSTGTVSSSGRTASGGTNQLVWTLTTEYTVRAGPTVPPGRRPSGPPRGRQGCRRRPPRPAAACR